MKLIPLDAVLAEIEKLKGKISDSSSYCNGWQHALRMLELSLYTLEVKVDLEKHLKEDIEDVFFDLDGVAVKGATHYLTVEDIKVLCDGCEEECIEKINEERKRDLSLWSLGDFENNFFEIIKPYKDSRNYKNLCIRLVVWRSELWRWIHWKKRKEEPVSENLEEFINTIKLLTSNTALLTFEYGCREGANWQKEQMMAKAVDTIVKVDAGGYPYIDRTIELYDYDKDIPLAKKGDKVKIVVIKED